MRGIFGKYADAIAYGEPVDSEVVARVTNLCNQPFAQGSVIRVMPDARCIGTTGITGLSMVVYDAVAPCLMGSDIGCGTEVVKLGYRPEVDLKKLDEVIRTYIPSGNNLRERPHKMAQGIDLSVLRCRRYINIDRAELSCGTLGIGNHFIELDKGPDGKLYLVIHTDSRQLGVEVARYYKNAAMEQHGADDPNMAYLTDEKFENYISDAKLVQRFATYNRFAIADTIARHMNWGPCDNNTFTTTHTYIDTRSMILRTGAVNADSGRGLIISLNEQDGNLICVGKGNPNWNCSAPHSANASAEALKNTIDIVERIVPVYNFKAN